MNGINAIANNIPLVVKSLGGTPDISTALQITAAALHELFEHWKEIEKCHHQQS